MRRTDLHDGKIQLAYLDSVSELIDAVMEPTGANCEDQANAQLARDCLMNDGDRMKLAVKQWLTPQGEFDAEIEKAKRLVEQALDELGVRRDKPKRKMRRNLEAGDELCSQAWLRRDVNGWSEMHSEPRPRAHAKIAMNVSMGSRLRGEGALVSRGAMCAAVSDVLETIGFTTEITMYDVTTYAGARCATYAVEVPVKALGAQLDASQVAFMGSNYDFVTKVVYSYQARFLRGSSYRWGGPGSVPHVMARTQDLVMDKFHSIEAMAAEVKRLIDALNSGEKEVVL